MSLTTTMMNLVPRASYKITIPQFDWAGRGCVSKKYFTTPTTKYFTTAGIKAPGGSFTITGVAVINHPHSRAVGSINAFSIGGLLEKGLIVGSQLGNIHPLFLPASGQYEKGDYGDKNSHREIPK